MQTSTIVHGVVSIKVERVQFRGFHSTQFTLTQADGSVATFDAFSAEPLAINDLGGRVAAECAAQPVAEAA
jgi:hypothetical protein